MRLNRDSEKPNMELSSLQEGRVLATDRADVAISREKSRHRRLSRLAVALTALLLFMWGRMLAGDSPYPGAPHLTGRLVQMIPLLLLVLILGAAVLAPLLFAGRSPHVLYLASEIDLSIDDVKGAPVLVEEVV